jgi:hypothetical protein
MRLISNDFYILPEIRLYVARIFPRGVSAELPPIIFGFVTA